MKANKLMIGDWVLYNETPQQILEISGIDDEVYLETDELVHQSEIEPIPLTPEILEKNGFKLDKEDGWWWLTPKIGITLWEDGDIELEFENKHSSVNIHIKYLHQLQQALRFCGIEKDIIL